jgi:adenosylcobinamide kinase/adenosylcobinamide-phosphate guanylyltransferase
MRLHLVTGGVRCGKSRHAEERARALGGDAVTYIATARVVDEEMRRRIERHRASRPAYWATREAPDDADTAVRTASTPVVLLECLTTLLASALERARPDNEDVALDAMDGQTVRLLNAAAARDGDLIVVTNEVGWGVHPETALGRWFRDGLGRANQRVASESEEVVLLVAGLPLALKPRGDA